MHLLHYRQQMYRPVICPTFRRRARKAIAALPAGSEWELYRKGLFSREWKLVDYGIVSNQE